MGFLGSIGSALGFGGSGAAKKAMEAQLWGNYFQQQTAQNAQNQADARLQPYVDLGTENIGQYQQLLDPQARYDAVMSNPLLQGALDATARQTNAFQASRGKLNSGETVNALFGQNFNLLNSLGQQELGNALTPVQIGQSSAAGSAANILNSGAQMAGIYGNQGDIVSSGRLAQENARSNLGQNLLSLGGMAAGTLLGGGMFFSDERLKEDMEPIGTDFKGITLYKGKYKGSNDEYIMKSAQEVARKDPVNVLLHPSGALMVTEKHKPMRLANA